MTELYQDVLQSYGNNDELIFAHVIFRHGQRNILRSFPNDPFQDEVHWPEGYGQLTNAKAKLKSGPLIKEMIELFSEKINSSLKPDRSLWLYSAHDFTISNVLNSLKLFEPHLPPTGSSLHFELFKSTEGEHYFQIFYRKMNEEYPSPMKIPGCGDKCTLKQFYDLYEDIIPEEDSDQPNC